MQGIEEQAFCCWRILCFKCFNHRVNNVFETAYSDRCCMCIRIECCRLFACLPSGGQSGCCASEEIFRSGELLVHIDFRTSYLNRSNFFGPVFVCCYYKYINFSFFYRFPLNIENNHIRIE